MKCKGSAREILSTYRTGKGIGEQGLRRFQRNLGLQERRKTSTTGNYAVHIYAHNQIVKDVHRMRILYINNSVVLYNIHMLQESQRSVTHGCKFVRIYIYIMY